MHISNSINVYAEMYMWIDVLLDLLCVLVM